LKESQPWEFHDSTKCHLDVGLVEKHRVYYKREGGGFPQVWAMVSLMNPSLLVAHPNTKSDAPPSPSDDILHFAH
jgi:hypothetical protein